MFGQGKIKGGAGIRNSFGPGAPAVPMDDAPDVGQANACAFEFRRAVEPLENPEEFARVLHVKADPVVPDEKDGLPVVVGGGKRALPSGARLDLDLLDTHRFANGAVYLRYRFKPA